jgi:hypothetical protein
MQNVISLNELSRLNPDKLYWYYRQLCLSLNTTEFGSHQRRVILASIENVQRAMNLNAIGQWKQTMR